MATKQDILNNAGYRYSIDRKLYFNRTKKKAFSIEFIEDRPEDELEMHVCHDEPTRDELTTEWRFFFNSPPSVAVQRELSAVLG